jgi:transcriptional regulator with XRE-family HTH domain
MFFHSNLKLLRARKSLTQDDFAKALKMKRPTYSGYENGISQPNLHTLIEIAKYFDISIDTLVKVDLNKVSKFHLSELERGFDVFVKGSQLRVLTTTVDSGNKENVEMVPLKAKAGYKNGFADLDFIKKLPTFQLPILLNDRKYRMFQIDGDSMLPIPDKSWVIGEYVEDWFDIKNGQAYILLTHDDGIVFKVAENMLRAKKMLTLRSLNPEFHPYEISVTEVREVWRFCNYISNELPDPLQSKDELLNAISKVEEDLGRIKSVMEREMVRN